MRQIIYCYGDGHPMMLNCDTINDADRSAILRHLTSPIRSQAVSSVLALFPPQEPQQALAQPFVSSGARSDEGA